MGEREFEQAFVHSYEIVQLEKDYGFFTEKALQETLVVCQFNETTFEAYDCVGEIDFLRHCNKFYTTAIWTATPMALGFILILCPKKFPLCFSWAITTAMTASFIFAIYPVAPPRLVEDLKIFDSLAVLSGVHVYGLDPKIALGNPYAAMPSVHTAWSFITHMNILIAVYHNVKHHWGKKRFVAWMAGAWIGTIWYPLLTVYIIVVSGNHYWSDALAGVVLSLCCYVLCYPFRNYGRMHKLEKIVHGDLYDGPAYSLIEDDKDSPEFDDL